MNREECVRVVLERVAVRDQPCDIEPVLSEKIQIDLDAICPFPLRCLKTVGIRTEQREFLEVEKRPLEPFGRCHADNNDGSARVRYPYTDLQGFA